MTDAKWTQADVDRINALRGVKLPAHLPPPKKSKYRNVRTKVEGILFDSKKEADAWVLLRNREANGEITELERQVEYPLCCPDPVNPSMSHLVALYRADYRFRDAHGVQRTIDIKSVATKTQLYELKKKWVFLQFGVEIEEW